MSGSSEWDSRMVDSLKNFDLSSPEVKQQFGEFGIDCFCYMFHLPNVYDYNLRTLIYWIVVCLLATILLFLFFFFIRDFMNLVVKIFWLLCWHI